MVERPSRPHPEQLAQELRFVLTVGTRAASIEPCISKVRGLVEMYAPGEADAYYAAIAVCRGVEQAVDGLGDGPYGRAGAHLFGLSDEGRGLTLVRRRALAAKELDVQPPTVVRWWQGRVVADVAQVLTAAIQPGQESPKRSDERRPTQVRFSAGCTGRDLDST